MEKYEDINFDTDLDDDDDQTDQILPRLSFEKKLAAHRSNRLNIPFQSNIELDTLIPIRRGTSIGRIRTYENSCHILDVTIDWQLRALLLSDNITILNRSFCFNDIRAFSTAIEANLESLTLSSVGLTSRTINILCQGLNKCIHLYLLDLSYNKIGKQGFEILIDTLNHLSSLLYLSLVDCGIQDSYGRRINDLCRHKRLMEINLSGNQFEEMGCILIGNALTDNISLIYLNLSWNFIRSYASIALFRGFEINKTLTEFDISWSGLGYDGSVALRRVLIVNKILQSLNISNCNIDWTCAKLISEGLEKNFILNTLNLSFNPLTTHGVHRIVQALNRKNNAVSMLDLSVGLFIELILFIFVCFYGITVFSATVRLAEKIADQRHFIMKYDFEIPVHDIIGRQQVTKADSTRKIIEHIDQRNWRTLDYFRILESKKKLELQNETLPHNISKFNANRENNTMENLTDRLVQPFTYKNLTSIINQQRMRDRSQKARQEKQEKDVKKRNKKILQTVNQHFPDIDIISKREKHKEAIEQLAKPRMFSGNRKN